MKSYHFIKFKFALLGIGLLAQGIATAAPIFDINFSADNAGDPPATSFIRNPGEPVLVPYSATAGRFTVEEDYAAGAAILAGKSVVFQVNGPDSQTGSLAAYGAGADYVPDQDYVLKFDLLFNGDPGKYNGASSLSIGLNGGVIGGSQAEVAFGAGANGDLQLYGANNTTIPNAWTVDQVLHVELRVLYSTNELEVLVNSSLMGSVNLKNVSPPEDRGILSFSFNNASETSKFEVAIANIQGHAIPEPGSLSAVLLGGGLLLLTKKFASRH